MALRSVDRAVPVLPAASEIAQLRPCAGIFYYFFFFSGSIIAGSIRLWIVFGMREFVGFFLFTRWWIFAVGLPIGNF